VRGLDLNRPSGIPTPKAAILFCIGEFLRRAVCLYISPSVLVAGVHSVASFNCKNEKGGVLLK
jgi:hypothetical protein